MVTTVFIVVSLIKWIVVGMATVMNGCVGERCKGEGVANGGFGLYLPIFAQFFHWKEFNLEMLTFFSPFSLFLNHYSLGGQKEGGFSDYMCLFWVKSNPLMLFCGFLNKCTNSLSLQCTCLRQSV